MPTLASALCPGTVFARDYRVSRRLAEGGMGAVYVVEQLSTGRERALKLMHPDLLNDPSFARRFVQEARVGAGIESDHIVEVLAAGIDESLGLPWLVMELLKGEDLASVLAHKGVLSRLEIGLIFEQLCHALAAAHARGVVHRDLKPENIFLAASRTTSVPFTVKVLDFGIAKVAAEGRTHSTAPLGSPLWMAPEQTEAGREVSAATDVWACGLLAFRMFTGHSYWRGAELDACSPVMLLREVVFEELVPASQRAKETGSEQNLPTGFDAWFARCVERDISLRWANAAEMYRAFVPLVAGVAGEPGVDTLGKTMSAGEGLAALPATPWRTPRAVVRPLGEEEAPAGVPRPRRPGQLVWIAGGVAALMLVMGVVFGVRGVIDEARDAAARVVSSVQQEQRDDKERLETEELRRRLAARRAEWDRRLGPMLAVPAGTFEMGADEEQNNEKPVHKVSVAAFELDESEVSVAAWQLCVGAGRCTSPATGARCNWGQPERRGHPINCVDWAQASAFCDWAAKRLPTEEEWEYAVRLGSGASYPWGKGEPSEPLCWRREESGGEGGGTCLLAEVQYDATPLRVRGMAGNVHEWTSSAYCPYTRKDCDAKARVLRGGSWRDRESHALRAMTRMYKATDFQADDAGLRCARNAL